MVCVGGGCHGRSGCPAVRYCHHRAMETTPDAPGGRRNLHMTPRGAGARLRRDGPLRREHSRLHVASITSNKPQAVHRLIHLQPARLAMMAWTALCSLLQKP